MSLDKPIGVPVNKHGGRLDGMGHKSGKKDIHMLWIDPPRYDDHIRVHTLLLQHLAVGHPYSGRHMSLVKEEDPGKSSKWLTNKHNETFAAWLKDECDRHPYDLNNDSE
jgi:hypothetical protein